MYSAISSHDFRIILLLSHGITSAEIQFSCAVAYEIISSAAKIIILQLYEIEVNYYQIQRNPDR